MEYYYFSENYIFSGEACGKFFMNTFGFKLRFKVNSAIDRMEIDLDNARYFLRNILEYKNTLSSHIFTGLNLFTNH